MSREGFRLEEVAGVRIVRSEALSAVPGVAHAFSTRVAFGRADFDLGAWGSVPPETQWRREAFLRSAGLPAGGLRILRQVHGSTLVEYGGTEDPSAEGDGALARLDTHGRGTLAVRSADCVAILIADRSGRAAAAVHAGWRGTAAAIVARAVARLEELGCPPGGLVAALGPAVLGCCYEVEPHVVEALAAVSGPAAGFARHAGEGRLTVDLHAANAFQLAGAGLPAASIHRAPWCTRCRNDLFFSVRAEGASAGRLMAGIGRSVHP